LQTVTDLILREAFKLIEDERKVVLEQLELGGAIQDYASYREKVGYLAGFRRTLEIFEEAAVNVEKRT